MRPSLLPHYTLLFVVLFTGLHFVLAHEGIYDFDDYTYARYAHQLATGTFEPAPPLGHPDHIPLHNRLLVFGPVALLYRLLGVGIWTTTLWPLLCTVGSAGLVWSLYRRRAPLVAATALLLLGLHYFTLNLSTYLYPDNILMFWCLCCAAALLRGREPGRRPGRWGVLFAGLNFAALLSKETIVYYLPAYLLLLAADLARGRHRRFWAAALLTGTLLLAAYLGYYYLVTGQALYPFQLVEHTNEKLKFRTYAQGQAHLLLARVTWQPLALLVGTGLGLGLLLGLRAAAGQRRHPEARFWLALAGSALLFYWLGSTSLTYYNPTTLVPRMLAPILPPLCLAAGFGLEHYWQTRRGGGWLALGLLLCAAWLHNSVSVVYGLLGLGFGTLELLARWQPRAAVLRPGSGALATTLLLLLALALSLRPVYLMTKPTRSAYFAQQRVLRRELRGPAGGVVLADAFLLRHYDFSYGFRVPAGLRFLPYAAHDTLAPAAGRPVWLLLNRATLRNDDLVPHLIPYSAAQVLASFPRRRLVVQDGDVELYRLAR